jgi:hypothetical protein
MNLHNHNREPVEEMMRSRIRNQSVPAEVKAMGHRRLAVFRRQLEQSKSPQKESMIMAMVRSNTIRIATAAVIIAAVLVGFDRFGGATVAWAEVVEQMTNYTRYKYRQRVVRESGQEFPTMNVYHMNLSQRRQELENGDIHVVDMRGTNAITVEMSPAIKKARVTKLLGFGPRKDPNVIEMVKQFELEPTERLGTKEAEGKTLHGFRHVPNEGNDYTVWVDPETKLPVEIKLTHTQRGQTIFLDEFEFDFDLGPAAFSTEVPADYEVETLTSDYRPVEPTEVAAQDIANALNHTAYTVGNLPWIAEKRIVRVVDPLGTRSINYVIGIRTDKDNTLLIVQGNYYDLERMVWIHDQQLVLETQNEAKLYTHPNGAVYAQYFLESLAKTTPDLFDETTLSEDRSTRMIVMPNGTVLGLVASKQIADKEQRELVESLRQAQ